jgi:hypothetical protein
MVMAVTTALAVAAVYAGQKFREIAKYYYGRATFVVGESRRPWDGLIIGSRLSRPDRR